MALNVANRPHAAADDILVEEGRAVIDLEANAVASLAGRLGEAFGAACRLILACRGRVVVVGMGKSGHIGGKIAATLASTGTPAFFVHPGEASHGDLGMITPADLVLAISNSGETPEILTILPVIKRMGVKMVAFTGGADSTLALQADVCLDVGVPQEACPLNLAPTSSTTATLAMGDALAVALFRARGFTERDFARSHPGGVLGRRLLVYVRDVMHTGDRIPLVRDDALLSDALIEMSSKGLGMTGVVDTDRRLIGVFTDGDLRRSLSTNVDLYRCCIAEVMTRNPVTTSPTTLAAEIVQLMRTRAINGLFVVDETTRVLGALNTHDLLRAGVM
ncbi:MAG: KpsF/GutQ family sugar-phosphate isomerase [Gammaproteobacteria bacterium]|nr:KpsF/GutQ family sugar-phosphate isomerase [Gammaproteobacteria bacterium]